MRKPVNAGAVLWGQVSFLSMRPFRRGGHAPAGELAFPGELTGVGEGVAYFISATGR